MLVESTDRDRQATGLGVTAIVVTYNSADHIAACLTALRRSGVAVHVVDNASVDGTARLVAQRFADVRLTANTHNVGFAAAVNQALAQVSTDVVLLVNPDCVLQDGAANALVSVVRGNADVGIVGPHLTAPDGSPQFSIHPFESWRSVIASRFGGRLLPVGLRRLLSGQRRRDAYDACRASGPYAPRAPQSVDWLSGACMAIRTSLLTRLGGLDAGYFMYYEDEDLCLRAWRGGARVLYHPTARAVHVGGASSSSDPLVTWPHLYQSMLRFFALHRRRSYPVVRATVLLRAFVGIALALLRMPRRRAEGVARARAWRKVAGIALAADPRTIERQNTCTS